MKVGERRTRKGREKKRRTWNGGRTDGRWKRNGSGWIGLGGGEGGENELHEDEEDKNTTARDYSSRCCLKTRERERKQPSSDSKMFPLEAATKNLLG